jgi:hypothetical protein
LKGRESMGAISAVSLQRLGRPYESDGLPAAFPEAWCLSLQTSSDSILLLLTAILFTLFSSAERKGRRRPRRRDEMEMMPTHASVHAQLSLRARITAVRAEPSIAGAWHMLS